MVYNIFAMDRDPKAQCQPAFIAGPGGQYSSREYTELLQQV